MSNSPLSAILGSIVVSISACHAEDRGSIPRRGVVFFFSSLVSMLSVQWIGNSPTQFLFSHSSSSSFSPSKTMEISSSIFKLRCRHRFSIKSIFPLWSSSFTPPPPPPPPPHPPPDPNRAMDDAGTKWMQSSYHSITSLILPFCTRKQIGERAMALQWVLVTEPWVLCGTYCSQWKKELHRPGIEPGPPAVCMIHRMAGEHSTTEPPMLLAQWVHRSAYVTQVGARTNWFHGM